MLFCISIFIGISVLNSNALMTLICSRHDCEQELIKIRKQVENLNKQLAVNLKKIKTVETTLQNNEAEFEMLQVGSQTINKVLFWLAQVSFHAVSQHTVTGTLHSAKAHICHTEVPVI